MIPADSEVVFGLNWQSLEASALFKQYVEPQMMKGDTLSKLNDFKAKCGFDPMAELKTMSMGFKNMDGGDPEGVVVVHGVDKSKFWPCIDKYKDQAQADGTTFTKDGDALIVKKGTDTTALAFANDTTIVAQVGKTASKDGVLAVVKGASGLKTSAAFMDMFGKIKTSDTVWMFINGNGKLLDKMAMIGSKPKAVYGSVNVTDGLAADIRLHMDTPDAASSLATMMKSQTAQVSAMVDKVEVSSEGSEVKFVLVLSKEKLEALIKQFGGMLGGMGGGM
ncbi:MAG TPA: hypothetical protein VGM88_30650 [Kofleriaceae bacterium]